MGDWTQKIQKQATSQLIPGETVVAGVLAKPAGTLDPQIGWMPGGFLGALSARLLQRRRRDRSSKAASGIAAGFPETQSVLGLSEGRLMAFSHSALSGRARRMVASVGIGDIASMAMSSKSIGATLALSFKDGSTTTYDVVDPAKLKRFAAAFETLKDRSVGT